MHPSGLRPLLALLALAFIVPSGSPARAGWFSRDKASATPQRPLLIAIGDPLARENSCACVAGFAQRNYSFLTNMVSDELRRPAELVFCHSLQNATERAGRSPDLYIGKAPLLPARCLARLTGPNGETTLQGLFIVRRNDPAQSVPDLAGRRILLGPPEAVEKYGAALNLLRNFGMALPAKPLIADTCTAAALAVTRPMQPSFPTTPGRSCRPAERWIRKPCVSSGGPTRSPSSGCLPPVRSPHPRSLAFTAHCN